MDEFFFFPASLPLTNSSPVGQKRQTGLEEGIRLCRRTLACPEHCIEELIQGFVFRRISGEVPEGLAT
jgi:hypothetical protein